MRITQTVQIIITVGTAVQRGPSRKRAVMTLRKHQVRNAFFLLLLAQGTPCILAGDEFYNSQKGNNNVYCQDNETGWVDWSRLKTDDTLFTYVKSLISFRKKHPCLHRREELKGLDRTACGMPDVSYHGENAWQVRSEVYSRQLGVLYAGEDIGDTDCFIAYNMHWLPIVMHCRHLEKIKSGVLLQIRKRVSWNLFLIWKIRRRLNFRSAASLYL